jgi:uncharacterized protein with FMN-binding domain
MKKIMLSLLTLATFTAYSAYYRLSGQTPVIANNISNGNNNTSVNAAGAVPSPSGTNTSGTYVGDVANAFYGNIQVQAVIQSGKIIDIQFLQYPSDRSRSVRINQAAMATLKSEAIQAQSANVDIVSGATDSSQAFIQSLQSALNKANL